MVVCDGLVPILAAFPHVAQKSLDTRGFVELEGRSRGALFLQSNYFFEPVEPEHIQFNLPSEIDTEKLLEILDEATASPPDEEPEEAAAVEEEEKEEKVGRKSRRLSNGAAHEANGAALLVKANVTRQTRRSSRTSVDESAGASQNSAGVKRPREEHNGGTGVSKRQRTK